MWLDVARISITPRTSPVRLEAFAHGCALVDLLGHDSDNRRTTRTHKDRHMKRKTGRASRTQAETAATVRVNMQEVCVKQQFLT